RNHGTHAEAVEVIYDPDQISYSDLLEFFFQIHDPTTRNRQGNNVGPSYRSAIFDTRDEQRRIAEAIIPDINAFPKAGRGGLSIRSINFFLFIVFFLVVPLNLFVIIRVDRTQS